MSGRRRGSQNTLEPQRGQKQKTTANPLADGRSNLDHRPVTRTASRAKNTAILKALPVRRWQSLQ
jgi:hypothetical protein